MIGLVPADPAIPGRPYTLVYDGNCNVCSRIVGAVAKFDRYGTLEVTPAQKPGVRARFAWIPESAYADSIQLIRSSDRRTWQGAAAVEQVIDVLPRIRAMRWIFAIPFVRPLAERLYRWFARNRYRLGCGVHCRG